MNNEQELDQKAIDELLISANKELSEQNSAPSEITTPQKPSASSKALPPAVPLVLPTWLPLKNSHLTFIMTLKQHFTKKIVLAIFLLLLIFISIGAFLGLKMANHNVVFASRTPLEKIIHLGITFEEKNFVAYAGRGDFEIVNAFLGAGMSPNVVRGTDGWSPLMAACFYKKSNIVELLLNRDATVNIQDKYGKTALIHATAMGAENIVIMLLEYGANPNIQDNNGRTPLIEAYAKQYAKIAEILKRAGADPHIGHPNDLKLSSKLPFNPAQQVPNEQSPSSIKQEYRLAQGKAGYVEIGMPLTDVQEKYTSLTVSEKYVDGHKKPIANIYLNNLNSPSLELELSSGTLQLVSTISTYDGHFSTDKQITIKSTVADIRDQYTINEIKVINNSLFLVVKSIKMLFELDLSKGYIPAEWLNTGNPASIPDNTPIKRIIIY